VTEIDGKLDELRQIVRPLRSCLVAFSGGVDSALVLSVAREQLGDRALACIGVSPSFPARERAAAVALAQKLGARYRLIEPAEHRRPEYAANGADRCYFCKSSLFDRLRDVAAHEGWAAVVDGTHRDDVADHVHGMRAAAERGVRSPLLEANVDKRAVRALARHLGLPVWDKPAMACLASRVPRGTPVTPEVLQQIERAEDVLADHGLRQFRVRHHGELARIEVEPDDLARVLEHREAILDGIRAAGYRFVTLDLCGFRGGSVAAAAELVPVSLRVIRHTPTR
jgi:uncharacterized protein